MSAAIPSTANPALAAAAMLAVLRTATSRPHHPLDDLALLASGDLLAEAGFEGFVDGLDAGALLEPSPDPDVVMRLLRRIEGAGALGPLYMASVPRTQRHVSGEYYTPPWLVQHVLDRAGFRSGERLVDPMCGAGAFLAAAIARSRRDDPSIRVDEIVRCVHGCDLNPLAVLLARAEYALALGPLRKGERVRIPVERADALTRAPAGPPYDVVAGNPPWVGWESLKPEFRERTRHLWEHHGLFTACARRGSGRTDAMQSLLGGGKKDLCMLATYAAAATLLGPGGRLSFVITRSVFKSEACGAGFRRFVLGDGTPLRVLGVDDFSSLPVFPGTGARACVLTLQKGSATSYPVPWRVWERGARVHQEQRAEPIDVHDPSSAWVTGGEEILTSVRSAAGGSAWRARAGAYTGGANGVFWLEVLERRGDGTCIVRNSADAGKREVPSVTAPVEEDLVFPLLRASDVSRFSAAPSGWILMTQDPERRRGIEPAVMASRYPRALSYLEEFRDALAARRDRGTRSLIEAGAPWWSMFSVSMETLSPWKVVWRRIASRIEAAVVRPFAGPGSTATPRPVMPQETCTFVACSEDEAHFLAGMLTSSRFNAIVSAFGQVGAKGFGAPRLLRHIRVPGYEPGRASHQALATAVKERHAALSQSALDPLAERAWNDSYSTDSQAPSGVSRRVSSVQRASSAANSLA